MAATYQSLRAFAKAVGRSHPSILAWFDKDPACPVRRQGPWTEQDVEAATAYAASRQPNRNYRQRIPAPAPAPSPAPVVATGPASPDDVDLVAATLEDLEREIRRTTNPDVAERLSKQVRALKVVREIQDRDRERVNAADVRADVRSVLHYFRTACMGIPRAVAGTMEGLSSAEIEAVLEGRFTELLGELKRGLQNAIDADAAVPVAVGGDAEEPRSPGADDAEPVGGEVPDADAPPELAAGPVG